MKEIHNTVKILQHFRPQAKHGYSEANPQTNWSVAEQMQIETPAKSCVKKAYPLVYFRYLN